MHENVMAGEGTNPWAQYGLNEDGSPVAEKKEEGKQEGPKLEDVVAENTALKTKLAGVEERLSKLPSDFEGMSKKFALVDKVVRAVTGEGEDVSGKQYRAVFDDLMEVARHSSPGFYKVMQVLDKDPEALDRLTQSIDSLQVERVIGLNTSAHDRVMGLAKKAGFKAENDQALSKMVFPFETSITAIINANADLKGRFLKGDVSVVDDIFNEMAKPHIAQRLREKRDRVKPFNVPKAPPRGSAEPGATEASQEEKRPDIRTAKGRMDFHKRAVSRWLDKVSSRDEE